MSTKNKFLQEIKEVCDKYSMHFYTKDINGIDNGTINNLPNYSLTGLSIDLPDEDDIKVYVSMKEFVDYICSRGKA